MRTDVASADWLFLASFGVALVVARVVMPYLTAMEPDGIGPETDFEWMRIHAEWEHDRVQATAKGLAATAGGFLTSVLVAALSKGGLNPSVSVWSLVSCLGGVLGSVLLALVLSRRASRLSVYTTPGGCL
ncbi:MAG: hypothetical protein ACXWAY_05520 [Acidimicrobiia bacterium]